MGDIDKLVRTRLLGDPTIQALLASLMPRDPAFRYWQTPDGRMFIYTTERFSDGRYGSAILVPHGKGARSGKKAVSAWRTTREVHHSTRRAAKTRALRLYQQAKEA